MAGPRLFVVGVLSALVWWGNPSIPARVQTPELQRDIDAAIDKGVDYLKAFD